MLDQGLRNIFIYQRKNCLVVWGQTKAGHLKLQLNLLVLNPPGLLSNRPRITMTVKVATVLAWPIKTQF